TKTNLKGYVRWPTGSIEGILTYDWQRSRGLFSLLSPSLSGLSLSKTLETRSVCSGGRRRPLGSRRRPPSVFFLSLSPSCISVLFVFVLAAEVGLNLGVLRSRSGGLGSRSGSAKERPENLKLCRRSSSDLSAREVEVTEVKVEKLRKESETGSDFSNKMTALCLLNIQRQRMLHEEALGLEMKKVLSKHKRRCLFILRTTKVKTTSSRFCSSEIKFCSQDLLGISYTPVKSRRLEWSFRRRSNNRYGTQRCCWSSSGSQHQQTENFSEHW
ncbi:hypothetical protein HID58_083091, partial [Brassica napus]